MTHQEHTSASSDTNRRRPLAPDTRTLDARSARAWTEAMAVSALGYGRYVVESESGETYLVDLSRGRCSCPDHEIRGERCKHLRRVALEVTARRVPPPGKRRGDCTVCKRETFVPESGPAVCGGCWLERGEVATDRETRDTVVVYRLTDETAEERFIDAANTTVADYPKNDGYPRDDPVVEVVYPFSRAAADGLDALPRYAFPYSRLAVRDELLVE